MRGFCSILLVIAFSLASTLCACASPVQQARTEDGMAVAGEAGEAGEAAHCHAPASDESADRPRVPGHEEHGPCGHCNDALSATAVGAKITLPAAGPAPVLFPALSASLDQFPTRRVVRVDHDWLPPPGASRTLLALACAFRH